MYLGGQCAAHRLATRQLGLAWFVNQPGKQRTGQTWTIYVRAPFPVRLYINCRGAECGFDLGEDLKEDSEARVARLIHRFLSH